MNYNFKIKKRNVRQLLILYGCVLFYAVFLTPNRYKGYTYHANLIPVVDTITRFYTQGNQHFWDYYIEYWGNLFGNIIIFMPFGFLVSWLYNEKQSPRILLYGLLVSISIELLQLLLQIGVCDIDDVILNTLGTIAGIYCCKKWNYTIKNK